MKRIVIILLILTGIAALIAAQTPGSGPFRQEGIASFYGEEFNGRPTASGEIFDASLFTAAHPRLPFGTILTVTNTHNNRQVTVRVNDRGPFVAARIIDVSRAAAEALDMVATGTAPVIIEEVVAVAHPPAPAPPLPAEAAPVVQIPPPVEGPPVAMLPPTVPPPAVPAPVTPQPVIPAPVIPAPDPSPLPVLPPQAVQAVPPPQAPPAFVPAPPAVLTGAIPMPGGARLYRLQVGSYTIPRNAVEAFDRLRNAGLNPAYERHYERQINFFRVVLPGLRADEIQRTAQILGNAGFREALIRVENKETRKER